MAFKGDLKNISLFDVLQTLHQNQQSGVLVVQRKSVTKKIFIARDGVRIFFTRSFRPLRLGEIFVRRGRITQQDVEILLLQQKQQYRPMGQLLIESGKVDPAEVDTILQYHAEDEIYEIFGWESGTFSFYDGQTAEEHSATPLSNVILDPAGLCLEAARRLDELERIRTIIPDADGYYVQAEDVEPDRESNGEAVCMLYDALERPATVNELRDFIGMSLYDTLMTTGQLLDSGLIRALDAQELLNAGREARDASEYDRSAQMFEKAHAADPQNAEILQECIEAVQRLDEPKRLSKHLRALGLLYLEGGPDARDEGIDLLTQSLRQDQDNEETMNALLEAFKRLGDTERAGEVSLKMARRFADDGDLDRAISACREGLELAPNSVGLRYQLAQMLLRSNEIGEARKELWTLIRNTESSSKAMRSKKAHDLMLSCYRLLLRIDPDDEEVAEGMREFDRLRASTLRRRKLAAQVGVIAAAMVLMGVIGMSLTGPSAEELLFAEAKAAYERSDLRELSEISATMDAEHPGTDETEEAMKLRNELRARLDAVETARTKRESAVRTEYAKAWEELRSAFSERPPLEALSLVQPYLDRLVAPKAAFLRTAKMVEFRLEFEQFLEKVLQQFDADRNQVAVSEFKLKRSDGDIKTLVELESSLAHVRGRGWSALIPQMVERLKKIAENKHTPRETRQTIEKFNKTISAVAGALANLDQFYYTVRAQRLRLEIEEAVKTARGQRIELLRHCQFAKARKLYDIAFRKADAVTDEEPRHYFRDVIRWLESTNTRRDMMEKRDGIDAIVAALAQIEELKRQGLTAEAYRRFKPLIIRNPLIQFERKYKLPLMITSTPKNADVFLNGKKVGTTPLSVEVEIIKRSDIVVRRRGFTEASKRVTPTDPAVDGVIRMDLAKETAWTQTIAGHVDAPPVLTKFGDKELLLLATTNTVLIAFDTANGGKVEWQANTRMLRRASAAPVVIGDRAYLAVGDRLHRIRLEDGVIEKKLTLPGNVTHDFAAVGDTLYLATANRRLVAVRDMRIVYDQPFAHVPSTRLLHADGKLYVGTMEGRLLVHDVRTGREIGRLQSRGNASFLGGIEMHRSLVVAGAEDGSVYAFERRSGLRLWDFPTKAGPVTAPPVSDGKHIYVPAGDGFVHVLDDVTGKPLSVRFDSDRKSRHAPSIKDAFLYVSGGNRLAAYDTKSQELWWEYYFERQDGEPLHVIAAENVVITVTSKSRVIAFSRDAR